LDAPNEDVGLHHWVFKTKLLLPVTTAFVQNITTFVRREPTKMFFEMCDALLFLHYCAVRLNDIVRSEESLIVRSIRARDAAYMAALKSIARRILRLMEPRFPPERLPGQNIAESI
jgi:hypothetical protein